jgi:flagellar biosynthesis/type III secretory pathway M-ring protein FliF/YscJ
VVETYRENPPVAIGAVVAAVAAVVALVVWRTRR